MKRRKANKSKKMLKRKSFWEKYWQLAIMLLFIICSPAFAADTRYCVDNQTLRIQSTHYTNVQDTNCTGCNYNYTTYQDFKCMTNSTDSTNPPSCLPTSQANIWIFLIVAVICLFLMFGTRSAVVNMIGSLILIVLGVYVIVAGIDFNTNISLAGTASSFTVNNQLTYAIGAIFIVLGIFRIAVAWAKMS